jgi:hypothetical protein
MRETNSSLFGPIGTTLKPASRHLCTMSGTNSTLHNLIGTFLEAASLQLCAMSDTNSTLLGIFVTSFVAAPLSLSSPYACLDIRLRFFGNRHFRRSLHLLFTRRSGNFIAAAIAYFLFTRRIDK